VAQLQLIKLIHLEHAVPMNRPIKASDINVTVTCKTTTNGTKITVSLFFSLAAQFVTKTYVIP